MDRLKTYVEGFDEALGGGIPRGSLVLVTGTPGTMKTALTFSILYENVKAGSKALYITLEESQEDLRAAMTDLGMTGLDDMELYILDVGRIRLEHKDEEPTKNWLDVLQKYIDQRVRVNTFDLIALDSLAALYSLSHLNNPRRELFHFFGFLKSLHATCFLISEVPSGNPGKLSSFEEEFLADGILYLGQFERGAADVQLRLSPAARIPGGSSRRPRVGRGTPSRRPSRGPRGLSAGSRARSRSTPCAPRRARTRTRPGGTGPAAAAGGPTSPPGPGSERVPSASPRPLSPPSDGGGAGTSGTPDSGRRAPAGTV